MNKLHYCPLLPILLIAGLTGCTGKSTRPDEHDSRKAQSHPLIGTFQAYRHTLDNGLKIIIVEDHSSPTFAYQTWYRVGSFNERKGRTGLAHLFEHMMFKGTKTMKEGEFDRILETAGTKGLNAFTGKDHTAYIQELPSDKLELIARLESDRMVNLVVDKKSFETEREVVHNERKLRTENSPNGLMHQALFELAFTKHSYRWPVIGYKQDLDAMSAQDAEEFYRLHYSPNNATIVLVGDIDRDEALAVIQKYYGHLAAQPTSGQQKIDDPAPASPRRKQLKLNIKIETLLMGYRVPETASRETASLMIIKNLLTGGKSSRLSRALVDTGMASSIAVYDWDSREPSLFIIRADMQKGKRAAKAENIIIKELAGLLKSPPDQTELERARNTLLLSTMENLGSNPEKADFIGRHETTGGGVEAGTLLISQLRSVTAADIQSALRKYFSPSSRTVVTGVPK